MRICPHPPLHSQHDFWFGYSWWNLHYSSKKLLIRRILKILWTARMTNVAKWILPGHVSETNAVTCTYCRPISVYRNVKKLDTKRWPLPVRLFVCFGCRLSRWQHAFSLPLFCVSKQKVRCLRDLTKCWQSVVMCYHHAQLLPHDLMTLVTENGKINQLCLWGHSTPCQLVNIIS